jgi:hypothetical protein
MYEYVEKFSKELKIVHYKVCAFVFCDGMLQSLQDRGNQCFRRPPLPSKVGVPSFWVNTLQECEKNIFMLL